MSSKKQRFARNKQKKQLRRMQRDRQSRRASPAKLSRKLTERLYDAHELIRLREYEEADELLQELDRRGADYPEVVEALMVLYQKTMNSVGCCHAAERLMQLRPSDPEPRIIFAQESMRRGRASLALRGFQEFIERWPDHSYVSQAKGFVEFLIPEAEDRVKEASFPLETGFEWCCLHEQSLALLEREDYEACIAECNNLLACTPTFVSARNNLAIARFQAGHAEEAVATVEETHRMFPDNRFAQALLAKFYFLTGRGDDAERIADQIVDAASTQQDSFIAALEALALMGRDEDLVRLAEETDDAGHWEEPNTVMRKHFLAYAKHRLGDVEVAEGLWKQCVKSSVVISEPGANLEDLELDGGHAPWAASFPKWVPRKIVDKILADNPSDNRLVLSNYPSFASLIPALLDRGDPLGREVAMRMAMADRSPPMLDALKDFAFGSRGSDKLRYEAAQFLHKQEVIGAGPHRMFSRGTWTEIQLLEANISWEPRPSASSPRVLKWLEDGWYAMQESDFDRAEKAFSDALAEEPDNCSAAYNLCAVWIQRDGESGLERALPRLEQLHREHPDYTFASTELAKVASGKGDFEHARKLLAPCFQKSELHMTEAIALFAAQAEISIDQGDIATAEQSYRLLCQLEDEDHPGIKSLRRLIDRASQKTTGARNLFWRKPPTIR